MERPWERGRGRYWERDDEDDDWIEDDPEPPLSADDYEVGELIDSEIHLSRWLAPGDRESTPIASYVAEEEACATTPSSALKAHASEYEGYTGNAGNTMDRWYHRAAIVVAAELGFAVRGEAQPAWVLERLGTLIQSGRAGEAWESRRRCPFSGTSSRPAKTAPACWARRRAWRWGSMSRSSLSHCSRLSDWRNFLAAPHAKGFARPRRAAFGEPWAQRLVAAWSKARMSGIPERGSFRVDRFATQAEPSPGRDPQGHGKPRRPRADREPVAVSTRRRRVGRPANFAQPTPSRLVQARAADAGASRKRETRPTRRAAGQDGGNLKAPKPTRCCSAWCACCAPKPRREKRTSTSP